MKIPFISAFLVCLSVLFSPVPEAKNILMMDTFVSIEIRDGLKKGEKERLIDRVESRMRELAHRFDYFDPESELSRINRSGNIEKNALSEEMREILEESRRFRQKTGGAFDARNGSAIDLGGIAKGFIVDEGIRILKESGVRSALINAGGDLYCIGKGRIGIRDPGDKNAVIGSFEIEDMAVATSGVYERPGHIIDPRTGKRIEKKLKSVTVVADSCRKADALATALFVLDIKEALGLIESIEGAECAIIDENGALYVSGGMPQIALTKYRR